MRVLLQRVTQASVSVDGATVDAIDRGLLLLVGIGVDDTGAEIDLLVTKVANLRIFEDAEGRMNRSALDLLADPESSAEMLVISQFTLFADARKGRRPSFVGAARPEQAVPLLASFVAGLRRLGFHVAEGVFGAEMAVSLVNDGPVTIWLDSDDLKQARRG
jgi:D-tyrosyl-tRNA(Tyr) deacylase